MTGPPARFPNTPIISPRDAEELAAAHMRTLGFVDASCTPIGRDAGVDVLASNAIAQVKFQQTTKSGSPELQRLVGAREAAHHIRLLFYAFAGFSRAALDYADRMGIALFTFDQSGIVVPVNAAAQTLHEARPAPLPRVTVPAPPVRRPAGVTAAVFWRRFHITIIVIAVICWIDAFATLIAMFGDISRWTDVLGFSAAGTVLTAGLVWWSRRRKAQAASRSTFRMDSSQR